VRPLAHEDHPQRALYAALRMQEEIKPYANQLCLAGRRPLEVRVGVNTGEVVVRSIRNEGGWWCWRPSRSRMAKRVRTCH